LPKQKGALFMTHSVYIAVTEQ